MKKQLDRFIPKVKKPAIFNNLLIFDTESILEDCIIPDEKKENIKLERTYHNCYLICSRLIIRNKEREIVSDTRKDFFYNDYSNPSSDYWQYILELNSTYEELYIVSHNAKYDTLIINTIYYLSANNYDIEDVSFSNPFFIKATNDKKTLFFFSSTNIFQTSIKKLGKELNLPKLDFDYYTKKPPLDLAVEYCRRDVDIITETLLHYFNFLKAEDIIQEKITIAGQAFSTYRQKYMEEKTIKINHFKKIVALEREAYHGGRTEVFRKGTFNNIFDIDKNSMYPNVMLKEKYPVEKYAEREFLTLRQLTELLEDFYIISYVYLKNVKLPIFGKNIKGKLCFPVGNFWVALHKPELQLAIEAGYIDTIGYTVIYKEKAIFIDYIKDFYNKRKEAKAKDSIYALFYKYFLNSLYGKFGQYNIRLKKSGTIDDKELISEYYEVAKNSDGTYSHTKVMIFNGSEWRSERQGEAVYSCPAIAGAVTAYGRIEMFKALKIAGFSNIYYMDTDSIFVNETGYNNIKKAGLLSESELGLFKLEEYCKKITINNVKDYEYITDEKTVKKLKGINLNTAEVISEDTYKIDYWAGYSNLIHNKNTRYYTEKRIKQYKTDYNKGIILDNGTVKPFTLNEKLKDKINFNERK